MKETKKILNVLGHSAHLKYLKEQARKAKKTLKDLRKEKAHREGGQEMVTCEEIIDETN